MKEYRFRATIEAGEGGGAGITFPYDVEAEFGTRANVRVKATFDGVPYSGSLMNCGNMGHTLGVLKAIREKIGKGPGDPVEVVVWKDEGERTVAIPAGFEKLLKKEKAWSAFEKLSYTHKKEYVRWITEAKREETRAKRLARAVEMLRSGVKTPDGAGR
ncbi:MAG TPA: YdeI/OmpD-associated family protein [Terracidiphilus sp.]|nr:YdeI/OmpD-associated family protein [Terracidiphilus sp.]